jgi:soluble lytic murein transglycosylase-like protein
MRVISTLIAAVFIAGSLIVAAPAIQAKEKKIAVPPPCPIDGTLRTADPKLLERFSALAGCSDQLLVAPATPADYIDPDGAVIIRDRQGAQGRQADLDGDEDSDYRPKYASAATTMSETQDVFGKSSKMNKKRSKKDGDSKKRGIAEYSAYGAASASPNLSGTGIVIRIVPEDEPLVPAAFPQNAQFAVNTQQGGFDPSTPVAAGDTGILSMRPQSFRTRYDDMISNVAISHRIDPLLLHAVIYQESRYRQTAVSHVGAQGLMQIMPGTGRMLGVHPSNLNDPMTNIDAGARLLRKLYYRYNGNFELVLAAYNAGEGAVQKYGNRIPPYRETQNYVKQVMARYYVLLAEQNGVAPAQ